MRIDCDFNGIVNDYDNSIYLHNGKARWYLDGH
jgi:hypothetical protein